MDDLTRDRLLGLVTALGVGLLVGAVRERGRSEDAGIAGVRTYALVAIAGAVGAWLGMPVLIAVLAAVVVFVALGYWRDPDRGITGEIAVVLTCLLGALALRASAWAAGIGVVGATLLHAKGPLHALVRDRITERELADGLVLVAAALVVLPLVPDRTIDPYRAFNPALLWKLVVVIMAIGALGHVAARVIGERWGLVVSGLLAGLVSSTAAVVDLGQRYGRSGRTRRAAVGAALLANLASLVLFVPVLLAVAPRVLVVAWPVLAAAGGALLVGGLLGVVGAAPGDGDAPAREQRLFRIAPVLELAALITAGVFAGAVMARLLGAPGAMASAAVTALVELQAAVTTVGGLSARGLLTDDEVRWTLVGLVAAASLAKVVLALWKGGRRYGAWLAVGLGATVLAAGAAALATTSTSSPSG